MINNPLLSLGITSRDVTPPQNEPAIASSTTARTQSSANAKKKDLHAGAFSVLLAQQLGETGLSIQNSIQNPIATESTNATAGKRLPTKSEANLVSTEAISTNDPSNYLASIMLQLPVQMNDVQIKDAIHDSGTLLNNGHSTSDVQSRDIAPSNVGNRIIQGTRSNLIQTAEESLVLDRDSRSPTMSNAEIILADSFTSTPIQQLEVPTSIIPPEASRMANGLPASETNLKNKESGNISRRNEGDTSQTFGALIESDKNSSASVSHPQTATPLTLLNSETFGIKGADTNLAALPKESTSTTSMNTPPISFGALPNEPNNYLPTDLVPTINSPLGTNKWSNEFSQKIVWMCTQQNQTAELHLNPKDLGPLSVTLQISNDQLTAQFTSPHSAVRDAIENAMPKLREILADNGIMLSNATVNDQSSRDRSGDAYPNQDSRPTPQPETTSNTGKTAGSISTTAPALQTRRHNGILDTFA